MMIDKAFCRWREVFGRKCQKLIRQGKRLPGESLKAYRKALAAKEGKR